MKKYSILFLILTFVASGCDNFLSVKPKAEIVEHVYFDTPEGFEDALYGAYSVLSDPVLYGEHLSWGLLDVFGQYYKKASINDDIKAILTLEHDRLRGYYSNIWSKCYATIGYVNNVLRNLERKDERSMHYYKLYKGEALGLRAYLHFDLLRLFAPRIQSKPEAQGIPYVTIYEALVSPFKNVTEVYDLIIKDLKEAEDLLKDDETLFTYPRSFKLEDGFATCREIHFNLYAAQALLARVYWMKGDLENALIYAKKVIDSKKFPLEDKLNLRSFLAGVLSEKETIWGVYSVKTLDNIKKNFYTYDPTFTWLPADDNVALYSVTPEEGNDMRGNDWFRILLGEEESDKVVRCMKIVNETKISKPAEFSSDLIEGMNLIRIPEMYLIAAEALLDEDIEQAQDYFDEFIRSRGLFGYKDRPGSPRITLEDINKERRKEFVQEGQYFFTLKRGNMDIYVDALKTTLSGSDELYTLLIPDEEFEYRYMEEDDNDKNVE